MNKIFWEFSHYIVRYFLFSRHVERSYTFVQNTSISIQPSKSLQWKTIIHFSTENQTDAIIYSMVFMVAHK